MEDEKFEPFEEDFEEQDASYQVWMLGYDENEVITDFEVLVKSSSDAELAVNFAKEYIDQEKYKKITYPDNVAYIEILVETIVDVEGIDTNVGTLFDAQLKI